MEETNMGWLDDEIVQGVRNHAKKVKKQIEEYQQARKQLTPEEKEKYGPVFLQHYKEQMAKENPDDREWFIDELGRHYIIFQTDDRELMGKDGKPWNIWETKQWNDGTIHKDIKAIFPLKTGSSGFPTRIGVTWNDPSKEDFAKAFKGNILIVAVGFVKRNIKYTYEKKEDIISEGEFLNKVGVKAFEGLDLTEINIYYNFNMYELLAVKKVT